ncbi:hypothetical protein EZV62_015270 [Acer yangbiense]|uniref:RNase H type-1 domain-containing protein n=1 Tax=Acer yangbiense TaxID=1000413 RepID=A0A5C7HUA6_9ROSI|nr:hypothetical protein EZV62_015270 [Acer yangbiense]
MREEAELGSESFSGQIPVGRADVEIGAVQIKGRWKKWAHEAGFHIDTAVVSHSGKNWRLTDHRLILLEILDRDMDIHSGRRFHYKQCWAGKAGCVYLISDAWHMGECGDNLVKVFNKLVVYSKKLSHWNFSNKLEMNKDIKGKKRELACLEKGGSDQNWERRNRVELELDGLLKCSSRKARNCIRELFNVSEDWKEKEDEMVMEAFAILYGLRFAVDLGLMPTVLESDAFSMVDVICLKSVPLFEIGVVIQDILQLISSFDAFSLLVLFLD